MRSLFEKKVLNLQTYFLELFLLLSYYEVHFLIQPIQLCLESHQSIHYILLYNPQNPL